MGVCEPYDWRRIRFCLCRNHQRPARHLSHRVDHSRNFVHARDSRSLDVEKRFGGNNFPNIEPGADIRFRGEPGSGTPWVESFLTAGAGQVGHVPEWSAPKVFDQLEPEGGTVTLGARPKGFEPPTF